MLPRQYRLLCRRQRQHREWEQSLVGLVCAVTGNHSFMRPEQPYSVADFVPSLKKKDSEQEQKSVDEQNAALVEYLMKSGTAKVTHA